MKQKLRHRLTLIATTLLTAALAAAVLVRALDAPESLHLYLTYSGPPETSIDINVLASERAETVDVYYDTVPRHGAVQNYAHQIRAPHVRTLMEISDERTLYVASLENLAPGTDYYFVTSKDGETTSYERKFRTLPGGDKPFRFINGGDMGVDGAVAPLLRTAAGTDPDFALIGGDMAYENGLLARAETWDRWLSNWDRNMITTDGRMVPIVAAIGNHDTNDYESTDNEERAPWYIGLFGRQGDDVYWSFRVGDTAVFYLLDSGHLVPHNGLQTQWLANEMERYKDRPHQFAAYHVPLYPAHRPFDGDLSVRGRTYWGPLFDAYMLDSAFEHHDHVFKRSKPIRGGQICEGGTVYVGDGCFGHDTRSVGRHPRWYNEKEKSVRHFWVVDVRANELHFAAVGNHGSTIDAFSLPAD